MFINLLRNKYGIYLLTALMQNDIYVGKSPYKNLNCVFSRLNAQVNHSICFSSATIKAVVTRFTVRTTKHTPITTFWTQTHTNHSCWTTITYQSFKLNYNHISIIHVGIQNTHQSFMLNYKTHTNHSCWTTITYQSFILNYNHISIIHVGIQNTHQSFMLNYNHISIIHIGLQNTHQSFMLNYNHISIIHIGIQNTYQSFMLNYKTHTNHSCWTTRYASIIHVELQNTHQSFMLNYKICTNDSCWNTKHTPIINVISTSIGDEHSMTSITINICLTIIDVPDV